MPNWVTNLINVTGNHNSIEKLRCQMNTDKNDFDFNSIIKCPEELSKVTSGSIEDIAIAVYKAKVLNDYSGFRKMLDYPWVEREGLKTVEDILRFYEQKEDIDDLIKQGKQYIYNFKKYGCITWYEWSNKYWGTKWNACDATFDGYSGYFCTAWSPVPDLIMTLSEQYPDLTFVYSWANEDFGVGVGEVTIQNGELKSHNIPKELSEEAYQLAAEILDYDPRDEWEDEDDDEDSD